MSEETVDPRKGISIGFQRAGHAHREYGGTCGTEVTVADIEREFYHPNFGGRGAWARDGNWGAIRHED